MAYTNNAERHEAYWLVKTIEKKVTAKGYFYLDITFGNKTKEINGKLWDYNEEEHGIYEAGDLVKISGIISQYNGADQIKVESIRKASLSDDVDASEFVPTADYDGKEMLQEIMSVVESVEDTELKELTFALIKDREEQLFYWPAAFKLHHAIRGGLLYHTLSIVRLAEGVCKIYPSVDRDLLMCGAIIHDLCKIDEFEMSSVGLATGYSVKGELLGHLVMGAMKIQEKAKELGISDEKATLLQHMIISHHGIPEYGAAVRPMTLEAIVLSHLDDLDAKIYEVEEAVSEVNDGEFTQRQWALDNRKLYKHGRKDVNTSANLI